MGQESNTTSWQEYVNLKDKIPDSANMQQLENSLYSQYLSQVGNLNSSRQKAQENADYYSGVSKDAVSGLQNLTLGGITGTSDYQALSNALSREYDRTVGSAINKSAANGVINSSVTSNALSSAGANVADSLASNLLNLYNAKAGTYNNLISAGQAGEASAWDNWNKEYGLLNDFYNTARQSEDANKTIINHQETNTSSGS